MKKKILSILLGISMLCGVLSGCGSETDTNETDTHNTGGNTQNNTENEIVLENTESTEDTVNSTKVFSTPMIAHSKDLASIIRNYYNNILYGNGEDSSYLYEASFQEGFEEVKEFYHTLNYGRGDFQGHNPYDVQLKYSFVNFSISYDGGNTYQVIEEGDNYEKTDSLKLACRIRVDLISNDSRIEKDDFYYVIITADSSSDDYWEPTGMYNGNNYYGNYFPADSVNIIDRYYEYIENKFSLDSAYKYETALYNLVDFNGDGITELAVQYDTYGYHFIIVYLEDGEMKEWNVKSDGFNGNAFYYLNNRVLSVLYKNDMLVACREMKFFEYTSDIEYVKDEFNGKVHYIMFGDSIDGYQQLISEAEFNTITDITGYTLLECNMTYEEFKAY